MNSPSRNQSWKNSSQEPKMMDGLWAETLVLSVAVARLAWTGCINLNLWKRWVLAWGGGWWQVMPQWDESVRKGRGSSQYGTLWEVNMPGGYRQEKEEDQDQVNRTKKPGTPEPTIHRTPVTHSPISHQLNSRKRVSWEKSSSRRLSSRFREEGGLSPARRKVRERMKSTGKNPHFSYFYSLSLPFPSYIFNTEGE